MESSSLRRTRLCCYYTKHYWQYRIRDGFSGTHTILMDSALCCNPRTLDSLAIKLLRDASNLQHRSFNRQNWLIYRMGSRIAGEVDHIATSLKDSSTSRQIFHMLTPLELSQPVLVMVSSSHTVMTISWNNRCRYVTNWNFIGGYMMNWIQGNPLGRKFKALVTHDGVFSTLNQYSSEELFFPHHDFGGTLFVRSWSMLYQAHINTWHLQENRKGYEKWDPAQHLQNWATPHLIIHNELDYRLPVTEGLSAFNVLQLKGVDSRFLTFPDENHVSACSGHVI